MTQRSEIAIPLCLPSLLLPAESPAAAAESVKKREGKKKEEIQGNALFMLAATFDLKILSPEP